MRKRLFISAVSLLLTVVCYAQWSVQDSLKLQKLLESSEELKLNPKAVRQIDFGSAVGTKQQQAAEPEEDYGEEDYEDDGPPWTRTKTARRMRNELYQ